MKTSIVVVALALAAGTAVADDATPDAYGSFVSTKTRAEVQAERAQVKRNFWSDSYNPLTMTQPRKTRNRVLNELKAAQESGELRALNGEDSGSVYLVARRSGAPAAPGAPRAVQ